MVATGLRDAASLRRCAVGWTTTHENEWHRVRGRPRAGRPVADVSAAPQRRQVERRNGAVGCRTVRPRARRVVVL